MATLHQGPTARQFPTPDDLAWLEDYLEAEDRERADLHARYPVPDTDDELWETWYTLGFDCTGAIPGPELSAAERALADRAYDAGWEAGQESRWNEVRRLWPEDDGRDRDPYNESQSVLAGYPAFE